MNSVPFSLELRAERKRLTGPLVIFGAALIAVQILALTPGITGGDFVPTISVTTAFVLSTVLIFNYGAQDFLITIFFILPLALLSFLIPLGIALTPYLHRPRFARKLLDWLIPFAALCSAFIWWQFWGKYVDTYGRGMASVALLINLLCASGCCVLLIRSRREPDRLMPQTFPFLVEFWLLTVWIPLWGGSE